MTIGEVVIEWLICVVCAAYLRYLIWRGATEDAAGETIAMLYMKALHRAGVHHDQ